MRERTGLPVLTDVHTADQCAPAAEAVDVLQIPAFLCRQTDLLLAAGETGARDQREEGPVPRPLGHGASSRPRSPAPATSNILLCERGASFGYNTLVSDLRACRSWRGPAIRWCSTPRIRCSNRAGKATSSGGQREFAPVLARAALAVGVAAVFIETHEDPDRAPSDGPNMIPLRQMPALIARLKAYDDLTKSG